MLKTGKSDAFFTEKCLTKNIGEIQTLVRLVQKGDLKIERAAVNAKMTVEQFQKMMENALV